MSNKILTKKKKKSILQEALNALEMAGGNPDLAASLLF